MDSSVPRDRPLAELLSQASSEDLDVLADLITDNGKGRLALDSGIKALIVKRKAEGALQSIADVLKKEICDFGGNTLMNTYRSSGVEYLELARDVAKKLGGKIPEGANVFTLEALALAGAIGKYSPDDAAAEGAGETPPNSVIDKVVRQLLQNAGTAAGFASAGGVAGFASALGTRAASLIAAPVAVGAAGYSLYEATGPAFRITVPAVLQIAKIRRKRIDADFQHYSERLKACL
ncbi:hypothetical protein LL972_20835 [Xanthomonas campestris pv. asclepiadis]|uniref:hypothetical protein n=1 Tax=Xanthomonas campestris TaxID=339 RepID=UPI001E4ECC3B|nr:hypothetical protein [Xanthomonas campestris]MCC4618406.1 hypothetical protein [Xanthomonas campestris pv. asclepiadis]